MFIYQVNNFLLSLILKIRNLFMFFSLGFLLNLPFFSSAYADATIPYIPPSVAAAAAAALGAMGAAAAEAAGGLGGAAAGAAGAAGVAAAAVGAFAIPFCATSYLQGTNVCGGAVCQALQAAGISCKPDPANPTSLPKSATTANSASAPCNAQVSSDQAYATAQGVAAIGQGQYDNLMGETCVQFSDGYQIQYGDGTRGHAYFGSNQVVPASPATPSDVGAAVAASPAAAAAVGAAARAASAFPPCSGTMGTFNGVPTCGAGANASPAEAAAAQAAAAAALNAAQFAASAAAASPAPTARSCPASFLLQSNGTCVFVPKMTCEDTKVFSAGKCVPADPLNPTKPLDPTAPTDPNAPPVPKDLPAFCGWAGVVCDAITWFKTEPTPSTEPTTVDINETPPVPAPTININFAGGCPATRSVPIAFAGISTTFDFSFEPFCNALQIAKPVILASASLTAVYIIAGRKENED